jgi:hypothetical protein
LCAKTARPLAPRIENHRGLDDYTHRSTINKIKNNISAKIASGFK